MKAKLVRAAVSGFAVAFAGWCAVAGGPSDPTQAVGVASSKPTTAGAPVVVELFTSEGCSSCPPADVLLAKLEAEQPIPNVQVIALEEHVDYWNGEGWIDPFSNHIWTLRQQDYAETLKNKNPYTPQLVVDGHEELIGNQEGLAREAIVKAASDARAQVAVTVAPGTKSGTATATVSVDRLTGGHGDKAEVWLAVTESGLHSAVSAGENSGSDLHHASVVRDLRKIASIDPGKQATYSGNTNVHLDSSWKRENVRVVAFVQEKKSRQILGAAVTGVGR